MLVEGSFLLFGLVIKCLGETVDGNEAVLIQSVAAHLVSSQSVNKPLRIWSPKVSDGYTLSLCDAIALAVAIVSYEAESLPNLARQGEVQLLDSLLRS